MISNAECTQFDLAMELLIEYGFEGIADCAATLMHSAMQGERFRALNAERLQADRSPDWLMNNYCRMYCAKGCRTTSRPAVYQPTLRSRIHLLVL